MLPLLSDDAEIVNWRMVKLADMVWSAVTWLKL